MSRRQATVLASLVAAFLLATVSYASAAPAGWTEKQVTTDSFNHFRAAVSGDRVIWTQQAPSEGIKLFTWKAGDSANTPVSDDDGVSRTPAIAGDRIVWFGYTSGIGSQVKTWVPGSGASVIAPLNAISWGDPQISETGRIVWSDNLPPASQSQVYSWKAGDSVPTTVSANLYGTFDPMVSGDRVAWYGSSGAAYQVFSDVATGTLDPGVTTVQITATSDVADYPAVGGDRVFWREEVAGTWFVKWWQDGLGSHAIGYVDQYWGKGPVVSGDRAVWVDSDGAHKQIMTWKLGDTQATTLTTDATDNTDPAVSGDRVVWKKLVDGYYQIMTIKVGDSVPTTLTTDSHSHDYPFVSGDRVVWAGHDGTNWQIFTAAPTVTPPVTPPVVVPDVVTSLAKPSVSPSRPTHGRYAVFSAYLSPASTLAAGSSAKLSLYHRETKYVRKKVGKKWRRVKVKYWRLRKTSAMAPSVSGETARLSARVKLAYSGSWYAVVTSSAAPGFTAATSPTKSFSVK